MDKNIYLLKLFWYFLKYLIIILLISAIFIVGFYVIKDTANVYIIATEGFKARASTIMNLDPISELDKYYVSNWTMYDPATTSNTYDEFIIRDFEYDIRVRSIWVYPWDNVAYLTITEAITEIDGEYPKTDDDSQEIAPPAWENGVYSVTLIRSPEDGSWHISELNKTDIYIPKTN